MLRPADIAARYLEEAALLWIVRDRAVREPHYSLGQLAELDERLDAQLDGLRESGDAGREAVSAGMEIGEPGEIFVAAVLEDLLPSPPGTPGGEGSGVRGDSGPAENSTSPRGTASPLTPTLSPRSTGGRGSQMVDALLEKASNPATRRALISALGWLPPSLAVARAKSLLTSDKPEVRLVGLAGLLAHRLDPEDALERALSAGEPFLRARALRGVGELGSTRYYDVSRKSLEHDDPTCRFWAAWSLALRTGEAPALVALEAIARSDSPLAARAADLVMRRLGRAPALLRRWLEAGPTPTRAFVGAIGALGDPAFVEPLLEAMKSPALARLAAESFEMITGVSLTLEKLDAPRPAEAASGPTDDPADPNVDLDADDNLPWPNVKAVAKWWKQNQSRYAAGVRYLAGKTVTVEHVRAVLAEGRQRQRIAAALELARLTPDQPLTETRAPGFRQAGSFPI